MMVSANLKNLQGTQMALPMSLNGYRKEASSSKYKNNCLAPHSPNFWGNMGSRPTFWKRLTERGRLQKLPKVHQKEIDRFNSMIHMRCQITGASGKLTKPQRSCAMGDIPEEILRTSGLAGIPEAVLHHSSCVFQMSKWDLERCIAELL